MIKSHAAILKKLPVFLLVLLFFVGDVAFRKTSSIVFLLENIQIALLDCNGQIKDELGRGESHTLGVGALPIAGSLQSAVELVSGRDYITAQSTSRWVAAGGILAGASPAGKTLFKLVAKGVSKIASKAAVRSTLHPGPNKTGGFGTHFGGN